MDEAVIERLETSFAILAPRGEEVAARLYARLLATHPEMHQLFPIEMAQEKRKLLEALVLVVKSLRQPDALREVLSELGRCHTCWDTTAEHLPVFCDALVSVMADVAGDRWSDQFTQDWTTLLELAASAVLEGHQVKARTASAAPA